MFVLRDFIMETLKGMKGNYPDFQIREYALNWYEKGKLTEEDLAEIEALINPPEPVEGQPEDTELVEDELTQDVSESETQ